MTLHPGATLTKAGLGTSTDQLSFWQELIDHELKLAETFDRRAVELLELDCPSTIVVRTRVAADECRSHAELCHRIASLHGPSQFKPPRRQRRIKSRDYVSRVLLCVNSFRKSVLDEVLRIEGLVQGAMAIDSDIQKRLMAQLIMSKRQHLDLARDVVHWGIGLDCSVVTALHTLSKQNSAKSLDDHVQGFALPGTCECPTRGAAFTQACEARRSEAFEWLDLEVAPRLLF